MRILTNSGIAQVTVYTDQALVTSKALVEVTEVEANTTVNSSRREITLVS